MKNSFTKLTMIRPKVTHSQKSSARITSSQCSTQFTISYSCAEDIHANNHNSVHFIMYTRKKQAGMIFLPSILTKSEMCILKRRIIRNIRFKWKWTWWLNQFRQCLSNRSVWISWVHNHQITAVLRAVMEKLISKENYRLYNLLQKWRYKVHKGWLNQLT